MIRKRHLPMFQAMLENIGITRQDGTRLDAGETGFIARQLEYVMAQVERVEYGPNLALTFVPLDTSVPEGAREYSYDQWDHIGLAKIITNYADDLPQAEASVKRFTAVVKDLGIAYGFTTADLRAIQFSRGRLNDERAMAAREGLDNAIDQLTATGNAAHGLSGFLNNSNITPTVPAIGTWDESTSPTEFFQDLNKLQNSIVTATRTLIKPDTLLLSMHDYALLLRPIGANYDTTILKAWLAQSPYIKTADQWPLLDTAGANGTQSRMVMYKRDPRVVSVVIPMQLRQLPPQWKNLQAVINGEASFGGVKIVKPLGIGYMDTYL